MSDNREMIVLNGEQIDELVRCRDCKHLNKEEMRCFNTEGIGYRNVTNNDFCSRAERRMTKEEAICRLEAGAPFSELYDEEWENALIMAIESLKAEPIKHGKWIYVKTIINGEKEYKCSECDAPLYCYGTPKQAHYEWCYSCGARMDETPISTLSDFYDDKGHLLNIPMSEADPVKHGQWVFTEYESGDAEYCCSECGEGVYYDTPNYCPNCGAQMSSEENK